MNDFPLSPFLAALAADGIPLTVCDHARVALALQTGGVWTLTRLCDTLLALLTKDAEQQALFLRRFDEFFAQELTIPDEVAAVDPHQLLADLRQLAASRIASPQPKPRSFTLTPRLPPILRQPPTVKFGFWALWSALLGLGLLTVVLLWSTWVRPAPPVEAVPTVVIPTPAAAPVAQPRKRLYTDVPYVAAIDYVPLETFPAWQRYAGLAALFFFTTLLYGLYLWRSRKIPEDAPPVYDPNGRATSRWG